MKHESFVADFRVHGVPVDVPGYEDRLPLRGAGPLRDGRVVVKGELCFNLVVGIELAIELVLEEMRPVVGSRVAVDDQKMGIAGEDSEGLLDWGKPGR